MQKTILITGSTDGIGLEVAKQFAIEGHRVLIHGRNLEKLERVESELAGLSAEAQIKSYCADLSDMASAQRFAEQVLQTEEQIDALINNAGIFKTDQKRTVDGFDIRYAVNTFAPYLLTTKLVPILGEGARVVNLSSAAQAPVDIKALEGQEPIEDDFSAYAQSKLALTMWSQHFARSEDGAGRIVVSVNPGSLLATKMVTEGFGVAGSDVGIGANILFRATLSDEFVGSTGKYFDNDSGDFSAPHPDASDNAKVKEVVRAMENALLDWF